MEDIRIGRRSVGTSKLITFNGVTSADLVGPDANRIAITFSNVGTDPILVRVATGTGNSAGFRLTSTFPTITLRIEDYGNLVNNPWYGFCATADEQLAVFETFLGGER